VLGFESLPRANFSSKVPPSEHDPSASFWRGREMLAKLISALSSGTFER